MGRKKPERRLVTQRTNNNVKRQLALNPATEKQNFLLKSVKYGAYSKHKRNPSLYGLAAYNGPDEERTYCDEHASFFKKDVGRIPHLLARAVRFGLWSEQVAQGVPRLLWTIDNTGWIFEFRITNTGHAEYHGYPILPNDAFAKVVLASGGQTIAAGRCIDSQDSDISSAVAAAERRYK